MAVTNRKYLASGREVELIETTAHGHLVANVLVYGETEEEFVEDRLYFTEAVFDNPPVHKLNESIKTLREQINGLKQEKKQLEDEINDSQNQHKARLEKFRKYKQLEMLEQFIDGKITHYVEFGYRIKISEFKEAMEDDDRRPELKLLSLFGQTNGDLLWQLNRYRDGSGIYTQVYPCVSYDHALETLQALITEEVAKTMAQPTQRVCDTVREYNLKVPEEYLNRYKQRLIKNYEDSVAKCEKELREVTERLNKLLANQTEETE